MDKLTPEEVNKELKKLSKAGLVNTETDPITNEPILAMTDKG
jgi:DNA-binding MarR family transcriptional regulator